MQVRAMRYETKGRGPDKDRELREPTWEDIEAAIRAMDGLERTYVILRPRGASSDEEMLGVGGGGEGAAYVCFHFADDEYNLVDPQVTHDETVEVLMGEISRRAKRELVNVEIVLAAAKRYLSHGDREPALTWRRSTG